ncbi:uncharacterized protein LOC120339612 [Styela clava]
MMLIRLSFFFALCALALGNFYRPPKKCNVEKVSPKYYKSYKYIHGKPYPYYKSSGKKCQSSKYWFPKIGFCPNKKFGYATNDKDCDDQKCHTAYYYATSKCHGKVKLSKVYYYSGKECTYYTYGKSCQNYRYHGLTPGYHGPEPGYYEPKQVHYSKCNCYTSKCKHQFEACFKYQDQHYQGKVEVEVPCGCYCYKGYKKNDGHYGH